MAGNMYIPPTQNPFLQQSMGLLQNIGLMYLGHQLKREDQDKTIEQQKEVRKEQLAQELALKGYSPVTPEQQMGDVGNGPPPASQVNIPGQGMFNKPTHKPPDVMQIDLGDGRKLPVVFEKDTGKFTVVPEALKQPTEKQPEALIQRYILAKEQGFKGTMIDYQKELYKAAALANPSKASQDPSTQLKYRKYIDPKTNKYMAQEMVFNPKTKAYEEAKKPDGSKVEPYEIPKSFDLMQAIMGGGAGAGNTDAQLQGLNEQINALQRALGND